MGPKERREREREETRTRILDAARELFAAEGVDSVTMRKVAEKIEYSPTAIYFHFKDKESLLTELCECDFRAFAQRFGKLAEIADPVERLRAAGHAYVDFGLENPSHYRVMFMTPKPESVEGKTGMGNPEEDSYALLKLIVADIIAAGRIRPGVSRDAHLLSQVIWSAVHGVVSLDIARCSDRWVEWRPFAERAKLTIDMIVAGLTTDVPARVAVEQAKPSRKAKRGAA